MHSDCLATVESNLIDVSFDFWWLDTGVSIDAFNSS